MDTLKNPTLKEEIDDAVLEYCTELVDLERAGTIRIPSWHGVLFCDQRGRQRQLWFRHKSRKKVG